MIFAKLFAYKKEGKQYTELKEYTVIWDRPIPYDFVQKWLKEHGPKDCNCLSLVQYK